MKCPHCLVEFHEDTSRFQIGEDSERAYWIRNHECPKCKRLSIYLEGRGTTFGKEQRFPAITRLVHPKSFSRSPLPSEVPEEYVSDYNEACLVLNDSPKASAALSRRCLQHILRNSAGVKHSDLSREIQQVLDSGKLPALLSESLDAIRNIGNFAAHPNKSQSTGEIVDVEPGEAEWSLDVIEALFDHYFVQPEILRKKRAALDQKLKDAGKPPMK